MKKRIQDFSGTSVEFHSEKRVLKYDTLPCQLDSLRCLSKFPLAAQILHLT